MQNIVLYFIRDRVNGSPVKSSIIHCSKCGEYSADLYNISLSSIFHSSRSSRMYRSGGISSFLVIYIIKTVLNAIGLVALLVIWEGNHIDTANNYDYDNGIMISVLVALIISLFFHISCTFMVGQLIKEIDAGMFGSS